jgi:hypothetical protein
MAFIGSGTRSVGSSSSIHTLFATSVAYENGAFTRNAGHWSCVGFRGCSAKALASRTRVSSTAVTEDAAAMFVGLIG